VKLGMRRRRAIRRLGHAREFWHIGHGYRVTDAFAGKLARAVGKPLPRHGYELAVDLPGGPAAWLTRTPVSHSSYGFPAPKRGWVWYVHSRQDPTAFYDYVKSREKK
jgi:hypothetical protein